MNAFDSKACLKILSKSELVIFEISRTQSPEHAGYQLKSGRRVYVNSVITTIVFVSVAPASNNKSLTLWKFFVCLFFHVFFK